MVKLWTFVSGFMSGVAFAIISLYATAGFARTIRMQEMSGAVWIFVIVGAIIILLQLIPAFILFINFITTVYKLPEKKESVCQCKEIEGVEI